MCGLRKRLAVRIVDDDGDQGRHKSCSAKAP